MNNSVDRSPSSQEPVILHLYTVAYSAVTLSRGWFSYLAAHGFRNVIAASGHYGGFAALEHSDGVDAVVDASLTRSFSPAQDAIALIAIIRALRRYRPLLVHANSPKASFIAAVASLLTGRRVPLLYMVRGLPLESMNGFQRRLALAAELFTGRVATSTLYVSRSLAESAENHGVQAPRSQVLGSGSSNGVDTYHFAPASPSCKRLARAQFGVPTNAWVVGFVARLTPEKGVATLKRLWHSTRRLYPDAHLLVVGDEDHDFPLDDDTRQWLLTDSSVTQVGYVDDTRPAYAAMDVLVHPSRREGLPNVLLEAAATGTPAVAADVTGSRDVIDDGITGFLVRGGLEEWVSALAKVRNTGDVMGLNARRSVSRRFERNDVWMRLFRHYIDLIGGSSQSSRL